MRKGLTRLAWVAGVLVLFLFATNEIPAVAEFAFHLRGHWVLIPFALAVGWIYGGFADVALVPQATAYALTLRTERLVLRRAVPSDLEPLHAILSDPENTRHWDTPPHATLEETQAWLDRLEPQDLTDDFVVTRKGRVIGVTGCLRMPQVSFLFARSEWRQGYAREALAAYRDYIFERGLPYLCTATAEANTAARALLMSVGFTEVGRSSDIWRVHGAFADAVHYRLNADPADPDMSDPFLPKPPPEAANDAEVEA